MQNYRLDYFAGKNRSFVLIKNNEIIYSSRAQGLKPLVFCLKNYRKEMKGAVVFDKIIGRAAAILLSYGKIKVVWTPLISRTGLEYLRKNDIKVDYKKEVKNILNKKGDGLCLMEKMSIDKSLKEVLEFFAL